MLVCWLNIVNIKCLEKQCCVCLINMLFTNLVVFNFDIKCMLRKMIFYKKKKFNIWMRIRPITNRTPSCFINWKAHCFWKLSWGTVCSRMFIISATSNTRMKKTSKRPSLSNRWSSFKIDIIVFKLDLSK